MDIDISTGRGGIPHGYGCVLEAEVLDFNPQGARGERKEGK